MILKNCFVLTFKNENTLFISNINKIYELNINNLELNVVFTFKSDFLCWLSYRSSILRRLFRKDIRIAIKMDSDNLLLVKDNFFYRVDLVSKKILAKVKLLRGSRPLNMTKISELNGFDDGIYFGEYFTNPSKKNVKIYKYTNSDELQCVYEFPEGELNHIHNIVVDHKRNCLWLLSGDTGKSAAIYKITDNFRNVERIVYGKQIYRSCVLFPLESGLLYATDSQYESNSIRLLVQNDSGNWTSEYLYDLNGPCIFGTQTEDKYFFSTSVEGDDVNGFFRKLIQNDRGKGIKENYSEIVAGNLEDGFNSIYKNEKDKWPFIYFQFGNIVFPTGQNNSKKIFFTNVALKNEDFSTLMLDYEV